MEHRLNGGTDCPAGIDDIVHENDFLPVDVTGNGGGAGLRQAADLCEIIPVQGDVNASQRNLRSLEAADIIPQHSRQRHPAAMNTQQDNIGSSVILLYDFMSDALHASQHSRFIHNDRFQFHVSEKAGYSSVPRRTFQRIC